MGKRTTTRLKDEKARKRRVTLQRMGAIRNAMSSRMAMILPESGFLILAALTTCVQTGSGLLPTGVLMVEPY